MEHDWPWGPQSIYFKQWMGVSSKQDVPPRKADWGCAEGLQGNPSPERAASVQWTERGTQVLSCKWARGKLPGALRCQGRAARIKQGILHGSESSTSKKSLSKRKDTLPKKVRTSKSTAHNLSLHWSQLEYNGTWQSSHLGLVPWQTREQKLMLHL